MSSSSGTAAPTQADDGSLLPSSQSDPDVALDDSNSIERPRVHYALQVDTMAAANDPTLQVPDATGSTTPQEDVPFSPVLRRRTTRASTFRTTDYGNDFDPRRPGWQPGSEPGYDPEKPDGGHASMPTLSAPCEITVVDFAQDDMVMHHFENAGFIAFLEKPQEKWVKCRWININGLSWDVIQAVGQCKKLHKLAIEDMMNTRNRTKCDW
jgi:hypothetical protein